MQTKFQQEAKGPCFGFLQLLSFLTETGPQEQCKNSMWKVTFVSISMTAFTVTLFFIIGMLIVRHKQVGATVIK